MSGLERIHAILLLDSEARQQAAPVVERAATAEALELTLVEYFAGASTEDVLKGSVVVIRFARALAESMSPQAVEAPVVQEPLVPVEAPVVDSAPAAEDEVGGAA